MSPNRGRPLSAGDFLHWFGPRRRRRYPLPIPWRWRYEIGAGVGVPVGLDALADATHPIAAAALVFAAVTGSVAWPAAHRFLTARAWCVLVPHRLRVGMIESAVLSRSGWLPAVLRTSPHPRGVRVLLWCPAGVDVHTFHAARSRLAVACWAADVEIARHPRFAHIVVLLVVRHLDR